jgi:hypothetical protein
MLSSALTLFLQRPFERKRILEGEP